MAQHGSTNRRKQQQVAMVQRLRRPKEPHSSSQHALFPASPRKPGCGPMGPMSIICPPGPITTPWPGIMPVDTVGQHTGIDQGFGMGVITAKPKPSIIITSGIVRSACGASLSCPTHYMHAAHQATQVPVIAAPATQYMQAATHLLACRQHLAVKGHQVQTCPCPARPNPY